MKRLLNYRPPRLSKGGLDTRREISRILGQFESSRRNRMVRVICCAVLAAVVAFVPDYVGLSPAGVRALFILVLAASLWITEAIPAFSVGILVIALEIALLGKPGGVYAETAKDWERFVVVWGHPLLWLFFGGFVLAAGASRTGLDRWMAANVLRRFGTRPSIVMLVVMIITFVFSMFMSNTATAAMMMTMLAPILAILKKGDRFAKGLLLCVSTGASIGGMGTMIGTPPNAIAVGMLDAVPGQQLQFVQWMLLGIPPAVLLIGISWLFLVWRFPSESDHLDLSTIDSQAPVVEGNIKKIPPKWHRLTVMVTFFVTVCMWMTGSLHGIPTSVISFLPITVFTVTGVLGGKDMRALDWDILLLLAGGLALGLAVRDTGLARWLVGALPLQGLGAIGVGLMISYLCVALSNVMSNTAAANILVPIGIATMVGAEAKIVVPIALGASAAMCLPISTPPNAIVYTNDRIETRDFLGIGLIIGLLTPAIAVLWTNLVLDWVLHVL